MPRPTSTGLNCFTSSCGGCCGHRSPPLMSSRHGTVGQRAGGPASQERARGAGPYSRPPTTRSSAYTPRAIVTILGSRCAVRSGSGESRIRMRRRCNRGLTVFLSALLLCPYSAAVLAQAPAQTAPPAPAESAPAAGNEEKPAPKLSPDQLDALVAPIALYPDPLLSQALMASTYPLEIIQAQQWLTKNASLKGDDLEKAVKAQAWEPSVQATAMMPDLLKRLAEDITWTTNVGN